MEICGCILPQVHTLFHILFTSLTQQGLCSRGLSVLISERTTHSHPSHYVRCTLNIYKPIKIPRTPVNKLSDHPLQCTSLNHTSISLINVNEESSTYWLMCLCMKVCKCSPLINSMHAFMGHKSVLPLFAGGRICIIESSPLEEAQISPMGKFSTISL